jgi:AsmA protein
MKRSVKIGIAVIVGLPILAAVAIRLFVDANTFRPIIEKQLTAALSRKVTLGDLSLSVITGSLVASDLSIADDPRFNSTPFLVAKQLRIGVEMKPLIFSRQLLVRSFEADSPDIHLVRASDGTWNFSSLSHGGGAHNPGEQTAIPNLTVGEITIKDGRATIDSLPAPGQPSDNRHQVYDHLDIAVQQFSMTKAFPFTISATLAGNGTVNLTGTAGPLNPQDATLTPFDAQIALKHLDPVVAGLIDPALGVSMLADLDAHVTSNGVNVTSNGTIHAANLVLLKGGRPTPKPVDITYNVVHSLKDSSGQVQDLAVKTGGMAAHINGTYQLAGNVPTFDLKLVAKSIPIDDLQALMPAVGVKLPNGSVLKGGNLSANFSIKGSAKDNVIAGNYEINNTNMVGFNLGSKISGIAALGGVKTGDTTAIQTSRADIRMSKTGIEANNIYALLPALGESTGSGTVSPAGALNFHMIAKVTTAQGLGKAGVGLLTKLNSTAGSVGKSAAATGVRINITGTAENPVITADVGSVVKDNATQILNKTGLAGLFGKKK